MATKLIAFDAKTRVITGELPYQSFSFTAVLNGKGQWTATMPMSQKVNGVELMGSSSIDVCRTQVAFVRDGVPLFGGFVLQESDAIDENTESVMFGGPDSTMGPLDMIQLFADYNPGVIPANVDQFNIVKTLVEPAPLYIFQQFGILVVWDALSGIKKTRTWFGSDREVVSKLVDDLAGTEPGFDYLSEMTGDQATGFRPKLRLGYPQLIRHTASVLHLGKNISTIRRDVDGSKTANVFSSIGSKTGVGGVTQTSFAPSSVFSVYCEMDGSESRPTNGDSALLLEYSRQGVKLHQLPAEQYIVVADPDDSECRPGSFRLGDEVRLIASRGRVQVDGLFRIMSYSLSGDEAGNEKMSLSLIATDSSS